MQNDVRMLRFDTSNPPRVFAVALIVGSAIAIDPAGWGSFVTLRWAVVSTAALGLAAVVLWRCEIQLHRPTAFGWLVFLVWAALASIGGLDPVYTWIGTPDRHLGFVALALFALMYFAGQTLRGREAAIVLMRAAVMALLFIGVYTIFEIGGRPLIDVDTGGRPGGPYGTAAYLGAACSLLVPVSIGAAIDGLDGKRWRYAALLASGVGTVAALAAQTRAGWVGLIAAAIVATPAVAPWLKRQWKLVAAAGLALIVVAAVSPIGARALAAFDFADGTARGRIDEWQVGAAVAVNHPFLGVGLEGYRIAFAEGVDADYEMRYTRITQPDRVHNGALDVGVTTGLPGMALYLAMAVFLVRRTVGAVRTKQPWLVGIAAGVTGYLAQQWFLFPITEVDPIFWLFAGALVAASPANRPLHLTRARWLAIPLTILALVAAVFGVRDVAADREARNALRTTFFPQVALRHADNAIDLRPDSIRYYVIAAEVAEDQRDALDRIQEALAWSPEDPLLLELQATETLQLARLEQSEERLRIATGLLERLVERDPVHARYRFELGGAYAILGEDAAAIEQLRLAADLAPRSFAPLERLVQVFVGVGLEREARGAIAELAERGLDAASLDVLRGLLNQPDDA